MYRTKNVKIKILTKCVKYSYTEASYSLKAQRCTVEPLTYFPSPPPFRQKLFKFTKLVEGLFLKGLRKAGSRDLRKILVEIYSCLLKICREKVLLSF